MAATVEKKSIKSSETAVDRALEEFTAKMLEGEMSSTDQEEYERLLSNRMRGLVKLPSARLVALKRRKFLSKWAD